MLVEQNVTQQLAALVAIVSVAIIGVAFMLISPIWKGFQDTTAFLTIQEKRVIYKNILIFFGPFILFIFIIDFFGVYATALVQPVARALFLVILAIWIIYIIVARIVGWRRKTPSLNIEPLPFLYITTLIWIALCIFFCLTALFGVAYPMLNIEIGPFNQDNYNWARWFLVDGITFFVMGILSYVSTNIFQRFQRVERKIEVDDASKKNKILRWVPLAILSCLLVATILTMPKGFDINAFLSMPLDAKGTVSFTGTQFKITNESDFDWQDITFSINKQGLSSGYNLSYASLKQGETFIVAAEEFANNEGMRFDPQTIKPIRFSIDVKNSMGRTGASSVVFDLHISKYSITNDLQSIPLYVDASVNFSGTQFKITNESDFDWQDITFSINKEGLSLGYNASHTSMKQGEIYIINAAEFVNDEGNRFNPVTMKPVRFTIEVKNSLGQSGIYSGILK